MCVVAAFSALYICRTGNRFALLVFSTDGDVMSICSQVNLTLTLFVYAVSINHILHFASGYASACSLSLLLCPVRIFLRGRWSGYVPFCLCVPFPISKMMMCLDLPPCACPMSLVCVCARSMRQQPDLLRDIQVHFIHFTSPSPLVNGSGGSATTTTCRSSRCAWQMEVITGRNCVIIIPVSFYLMRKRKSCWFTPARTAYRSL